MLMHQPLHTDSMQLVSLNETIQGLACTDKKFLFIFRTGLRFLLTCTNRICIWFHEEYDEA